MLTTTLIAFLLLNFWSARTLGIIAGGYSSSCNYDRLSNKETPSLAEPISNDVEGYGKLIYLNSACAIGDGSFYRHSTALNLGGCIRNNGGDLEWIKDGNFQLTCTGCGLRGSTVSTMVCTCNKRDGTRRNSSIDLNDQIRNGNGLLSCVTPVAVGTHTNSSA